MGELDKSIGALPIFFLVLVISAAFVALNAGVLAFNKAPDHLAAYSSVSMPILFDIITLEFAGKKSQMTVLEAFNLTNSNLEEWNKFKSKVQELTPEKGCLALLWVNLDSSGASIDGSFYLDPSLVPHGFFVSNADRKKITESKDTETTEFYEMYKLYDSRGYLEKKEITFGVDKKRYTFMTYRGVCLNA